MDTHNYLIGIPSVFDPNSVENEQVFQWDCEDKFPNVIQILKMCQVGYWLLKWNSLRNLFKLGI